MSARPLPARLALAASGWLALLTAANLADAAPLRIAVLLGFALLCPGAAVLGPLLPARDGGTQTFLLVVMLSLSALVFAATALMLIGWFTAFRTLLVLAVLTTVTALPPARS